MTDNTDKLGGDGMDARAYEVLEKEFQEVRAATCIESLRITSLRCTLIGGSDLTFEELSCAGIARARWRSQPREVPRGIREAAQGAQEESR